MADEGPDGGTGEGRDEVAEQELEREPERERAQEDGVRQSNGATSPAGGAARAESSWPSTSGGLGDDREADDLNSTDVDLLKRVWRNEKEAPEILRYEAQLVERVQEQILLMEENIAALSTEISDELMLSLYRMDVNRALFLLRSYLRTRLSKIEQFPIHIVSTPEVSEKLSESELEYAFRYGEALAKHFEQTVLNRLPEEYTSMSKQYTSSEEGDMIPKPQLDTFVFCKSKGTIGAFQLDDKGDETVDLMKDDLHILRYRPVRRLLEENKIELI
ncbi:unnamed protein product [Calypogeia fissa]